MSPKTVRVLIVDDEEMVCRVLSAALAPAGHQITIARTGEEACAASRSEEPIGLLIVDHSMPPERGRDIAELILKRHPAMKVLHVSGYPVSYLDADDGLTPGAGFIQKPFTCQQIRNAVCTMLA